MTKYRVKHKVWGEHAFGLFGRVAFEFKAGTVTPKSDQEEACLELQVELGNATRIGDNDAAE